MCVARCNRYEVQEYIARVGLPDVLDGYDPAEILEGVGEEAVAAWLRDRGWACVCVESKPAAEPTVEADPAASHQGKG